MDGKRIFMGPKESMKIQSNLGSTIAMAFDECVANPAEHSYSKAACARTTRWLHICKAEMAKNNALPDAVNPKQMLFGINQGCTFPDLRTDHMKEIAELDLDGYAIGGLAVGEPAEVMYSIIEQVEPFMPKDKPRYLMGVGTPVNILEAVRRGVDFFDCVQAQPQRASWELIHVQRAYQPQQQQIRARSAADRRGLRLPGLPQLFARVHPASVQGA